MKALPRPVKLVQLGIHPEAFDALAYVSRKTGIGPVDIVERMILRAEKSVREEDRQ